MDAEKYTYRVIWSEESKEFVALCTEFPLLSSVAPYQALALEGMVELVQETLTEMEANHEEIPTPLALRSFSGSFTVKTTPEKHRKLVTRAMEERVSLDQYVNSLL